MCLTNGVGQMNAANDQGVTTAGQRFDLRAIAGTELHVIGSLGIGRQFGRHWSGTLTARAEHHFIDLRITDMASGASGSIDSRRVFGFHLSADYRF